jgi:hypothetical protein
MKRLPNPLWNALNSYSRAHVELFRKYECRVLIPKLRNLCLTLARRFVVLLSFP